MDDLKLNANNNDDLEGRLSNIKRFTDDIRMQFGMDKYAKVTFKKGSLVKSYKHHTRYKHGNYQVRT